jgi:DNA-binding NarL/FixJ family response regulator
MAVEVQEKIRVLLVDDHAVVRRGLFAFLEGEPDIEVVGDADGGEAALDLIERLDRKGRCPHVVLMDLQMKPLDGIESIRRIRAQFGDVEVVALTSFDEVQRVQAALEAGASGYLLKDSDVEEIAVAIRAAHRGELQLDPAVARRLAESLRAPRDPELTSREHDVLRLLGEGQPNKNIAVALGITERTTRTHVSNILAKLGLSSRTQAALWAARREAGAPRQQPPGAS